MHTLGCPKNDADSRSVRRRLQLHGVRLVDEPAEATHIIINTCGFISDAKKDSIDAILSTCAGFPSAQVLVMGCLVERYREHLRREMPEVAGWFGVADDKVCQQIALALKSHGEHGSGRGLITGPASAAFAYLKISDGCDEGCTFCAIPAIKGKYRSVTVARILEEADLCLTEGARELILVGQDTTRWKSDGLDLRGLVDLLGTDERVQWVRVMYLQPGGVNPAFLEFMGEHDKLCRYLDIPFQHCHPEMLRRMARRGDGESYLRLLRSARAMMPDVSVRSTFIVGFPGETDREFGDLLDFVEEARFDYAGAFVYSPEEGTTAAGYRPRVRRSSALLRLNRLNELILEISETEHRKLLGTEMDVMVESLEAEEGPAVAVGRTQGQAPEVDGVTYLEGQRPQGLEPGCLVKAKITAVVGHDLIGELSVA